MKSGKHRGGVELGYHKTPDGVRDEIVRLGKLGYTGNYISAQTGIRSCTVYEILRKHGISNKNKKGRKLMVLEGVPELYESGLTIAKLANHFKCSYPTIRRILQKEGIIIHPHRYRKTYRKKLTPTEEYVLDHRYGANPKTLNDIACDLGVSRQMVHQSEISGKAKLWDALCRMSENDGLMKKVVEMLKDSDREEKINDT